MIGNKKVLKEKVFYWLLTFVAITIAFPSYSISSQAIIGFALFWVFYNSFKEKKELLQKNIIPFLLLSIPFWLALFGTIFTNDFETALKEITNKIPFLIFPLTLFSVKLQNKTVPFITKQFSIGVFVASLLALMKVVYFKVNSLGDYYYYDKLSILLNKHTTYFALFVVLSILIVIHQLIYKKINKKVSIALLILFVPLIYMLSVRISILALLVGLLTLLVYHLKRKYIVGLLVSLPIIFGSIYFTPNFQKRFEKSTTENTEINDIDYRKLHWESVLETISQNSLLVGNGTGSNRDFLYNKYKENKLTAAYEDEYNAHNQFLEIFLNQGLIGISLFLLLITFLICSFIKSKNSLALSVLAAIIIFMFTESILERHSGVIVFALFMSLFIVKNKPSPNPLKELIKNPVVCLFYGLLLGFFIALFFYNTKPHQNKAENLNTIEVKLNKKKKFSDNFENSYKNFWLKELADDSRDSIVKDPLDSTNNVLKITNNLEDRISGGLRSEYLLHSKDSFGYKTNYGFNFFLPENFIKKGEEKGWIIIHQWHDAPAPGFNWSTYARKTQPPVHLLIEHNTNGDYYLFFKTGLEIGDIKEIKIVKWPEKMISNKWYSFSCEIFWSLYSDEGYAIPKLDDKYFVNEISEKDLQLSHKIFARNMYNSIPNYFKFGIYRQGWEKYNRDIYFDDFFAESERVK
jgi:O-antigen ligase